MSDFAIGTDLIIGILYGFCCLAPAFYISAGLVVIYLSLRAVEEPVEEGDGWKRPMWH